MKNILILSNNCISNSESNGRIHGYYFLDYLKGNNVHNFFLRGNPDIANVKYINVSNKNALLNKISFGIKKINLIPYEGNKVLQKRSSKKSFLSRFVLFHVIRNFCFSNSKIINALSNYIKENSIEVIQIWGTNLPFIYEYGYKLSKLNKIPLTIFTGEDYPIKNYNYLNNSSLLFNGFQKKLCVAAEEAYKQSSANIFATNDLKETYEQKFNCKSNSVILFSSLLNNEDFKNNKESNILFYGGNLYSGRCESLIDIAKSIKDEDLMISVYGSGNKKDIKKLKEYSNISYHEPIPYNELLNKMKESALLLHVEGFKKAYIKDCKYAFSSKISDYIMTGKPVFVYGPIEISGIKFLRDHFPDFVAINNSELNKLESALISRGGMNCRDYFDAGIASKKMSNILENLGK